LILALLPAAVAIAAAPGFTTEQFAALHFLEGRWSSTAPDGTAFFEQYDFPDASTMRVRRFADPSFATMMQGESRVTLEDGRIVARWGEQSWEAAEITPEMARFEPIAAPGGFIWRRIDADTVEVTQRWADARGKPQSGVSMLHRV
jgi:hypothetical protein